MQVKIDRPVVLSIAGFDPSAGAGILADIKTLEAHAVYGIGIATAITYQNDSVFNGVDWLPVNKIIAQADVLFERFKIGTVKIGLIENIASLQELIHYLSAKNKSIQVIWDPILKASTGFEFHDKIQPGDLKAIATSIFLLTPNRPEMEQLMPLKAAEAGAEELAGYCNVLLKGGHMLGEDAVDLLFTPGNVHALSSKRLTGSGKHGSGCVLSTAIAANLAKGDTVIDACIKAKEYVSQFLRSTATLLGYHSTII